MHAPIFLLGMVTLPHICEKGKSLNYVHHHVTAGNYQN